MLMGAMPPVVGLTTFVVFPCCGFAAFETAFTVAFAFVVVPAFAFLLDLLDIFDVTGTGSTGGVSSDPNPNSLLKNSNPPRCLFFVLCDLRNFRDLGILYLTRTFTCGYE